METEIVIEAVEEDIACRLCLTKSAVVENILNIEKMSEKLHNFLQIEFLADDRWPMVMCGLCIAKIYDWEAFYENVRNNERILQSLTCKTEPVTSDTVYQVDIQDDSNGKEYAVVCIPENEYMGKMENEEEIIEDAGDVEEPVDYDNHSENFEVANEVVEIFNNNEDEDDQAAEEVVTESTKDRELPKRSATIFDKRAPTKRGRRKKNDTYLSPQYATQRDQEDDLIRKTLILECDHCYANCDSFELLLAHYRTIHNNPHGYVKCCDKTFKRRYVLIEHVRLHLNPDAYACDICQKKFTTKRHLSDHVLLHIPEEERAFQCTKCLKRYPSSTRLQLHMKTHNEELSFKCPFCEKAFRQEVVMKSHVKSVHEMSNQQVCEICAKVFKTKEGFQIHKVEHMEKPPEKLKCEICGGKYKNRDSLKYHMLRHKRAHERYYCDVCNKEFNCKKRMRSHRKYVHATDTELFQCTMCDKAFKRPIVLKEHMAAHTGQLLYTCAYCPKQFNSNANKYSHQKAQHPAEWELARQKKMAQ